MNISYTKIDPAGNITVIVDSFVPREQQSRVASELMKRDVTVEQGGFLEKPDEAQKICQQVLASSAATPRFRPRP